ncbi:hypothetical protein [Pusillimonas sp. ANT_WB101]|uniref:DUF4870 family protein n=1 Tax=Pusillimonas sp. ANT_WB101 TaxID=2597356 RepID=UPI001CAA89DC|nr:hypothetical protein [Pusillimonas sp. ANT_WB101]
MNTESSSSFTEVQQPGTAPNDSLRTYSIVVYAAFALGILLGGLPSIVGLIMAYVKRNEMTGTIYHGHMSMLIRTFWISLALGIIGALATFIYIGPLIIIGTGIWYIYRVVRGFICLNDRKGIWF